MPYKAQETIISTPTEGVQETLTVTDTITVAPTLPIAPSEPVYTDDDTVAVLHGPYTASKADRHNIDGYDFIGGVCDRVPYAVARKWQKGGKVKITIFAQDATPSDYLKYSGTTRLPADKLVAQLLAADLDDVFAALGSARAALIAEGLASRLTRKR